MACRLVPYFQITTVYYSAYVLVIMSIDRYEAICRPLIGLNWSKRRGFIFIGVAFLLAHLQGIPQLFIFSMKPIEFTLERFVTCQASFPKWLNVRLYIVYTFFMQFFVPLLIIMGCYGRISIKVFKRKNKKDYSSSRTISSKNVSEDRQGTLLIESNTQRAQKIEFRQHGNSTKFTKSKIKTIKLTLTVIILYIICSTPFFLGIIMNELFDIGQRQSLSIFAFIRG